MKKLTLFVTVIVLLAFLPGCGILKGTPLEGISNRLSGSIEKITGQGPEKIVEKYYAFVNGKNYREAQNLFVEQSREFYNPDYIKNTNPSFGKIEITKVIKVKKETRVIFNLDKERFLMAIVVQENGKWHLKEIQDDPSQVID